MPDSFIFHSFLYIKSNQLLSWKSSTQCSELHFGRMLLHTGKLLNPHPVPMLLQQLVNLNLKILLPWSTSSDTYCKPLLSNKRFQNNQILSWKKSTRSSNFILEICDFIQVNSSVLIQFNHSVPNSSSSFCAASSTRVFNKVLLNRQYAFLLLQQVSNDYLDGEL